MPCIGRCAIYKARPARCVEYPVQGDFIPPGCTFRFNGNERSGTCQPEVCGENNCCNWPREGGEPTAKSLDALAGGLPCKHLIWVEEPEPKVASFEEEVSASPGEFYDMILKDIIAGG